MIALKILPEFAVVSASRPGLSSRCFRAFTNWNVDPVPQPSTFGSRSRRSPNWKGLFHAES